MHREARRFEEAAADFARALENGADPGAVHYQWALLDLARGDRAAAKASARKSLEYSPHNREAQSLLERLK
jgi:tetratricopeptide (TPR) repeat protein